METKFSEIYFEVKKTNRLTRIVDFAEMAGEELPYMMWLSTLGWRGPISVYRYLKELWTIAGYPSVDYNKPYRKSSSS